METLDEEFYSEIQELATALKSVRKVASGQDGRIDRVLELVSRLQLREKVRLSAGDAMERVIPEVEKEFGISRAEIMGRCKIWAISEARHTTVKLIRELSGATSYAIGVLFGRHHGTILNSLNRAVELQTTDKRIRDKVNRIRNALSPKPTC